MREAQKMMNDPAFQAQMDKVTETPAFKAHMQKQQEVLKDPKKAKELEAKMQEKLKEGNDLLEKAKKAQGRKAGDEGAGDDKKDGDDEKQEDGDKKLAAAEPETTADEDDMPDIPNLNLN